MNAPHTLSREYNNRELVPEHAQFFARWGESSVRYYRRHGRPVYVSLPVHLGYLIVRETLLGNGKSLGHFLIGALNGLRKPLEPIPRLRQAEPAHGA